MKDLDAPRARPETMELLDAIVFDVVCPSCQATYTVTGRQILLAQDMLRCGCHTNDDRECLPLAYADLLDEQLLQNLETAWRLVEAQALNRSWGVHLRQLTPTTSQIGGAPSVTC